MGKGNLRCFAKCFKFGILFVSRKGERDGGLCKRDGGGGIVYFGEEKLIQFGLREGKVFASGRGKMLKVDGARLMSFHKRGVVIVGAKD